MLILGRLTAGGGRGEVAAGVSLALGHEIHISGHHGCSVSLHPGSLSDIEKVLPHHVLRLNHLDCNILLLDGVVGTSGKTLRVKPIGLVSLMAAKQSLSVVASGTITAVLHLTRQVTHSRTKGFTTLIFALSRGLSL